MLFMLIPTKMLNVFSGLFRRRPKTNSESKHVDIVLTPPVLIYCISNRYHDGVDRERIAYAREIELSEQACMHNAASQFQALVRAKREEEKQVTEHLTVSGVQAALKIVNVAKRTGML